MTVVAKADCQSGQIQNLTGAKKAKAGVQPERVREFEAGRAKLNESDVGLQDRCPKPTGAKKAKAGVQPERVDYKEKARAKIKLL